MFDPETDFDEFLQGYMECALWASTYPADDDGNPVESESEDYTDLPFDDSFSVSDIHPDTVKAMSDDCDDFISANRDDLIASGLSAEQAGHDFWLTREGHGAGFWDRGLGEIGERLTKASKPYGSFYLWTDGEFVKH